MEAFAPLLVVQDHDRELDRLRHRLAALPERDALAAVERRLADLAAASDELAGPLGELDRTQSRLEDEAQAFKDQADAADARLYSGEVNAVKELQALQADVAMLRRQQGEVEERALAVMEEREPLDAEAARLAAQRSVADAERAAAAASLADAVAVVEAEIAAETAVRTAAAGAVTDDLLALYERCRSASPHRVGVARLVGHTCQGCHLTIPAIEADALRTAAPGTVAHCDNCGAILVP